MKKINAAKLEQQRRSEMLAAGLDPSPPGIQDHEKTPYPKCKYFRKNYLRNIFFHLDAEYEVAPGDSEHSQRDKWEKYRNPYEEHKK